LKIRIKPLALAIASAVSIAACAADDGLHGDPAAIVVTATRQPMRVKESLADVTVIDRATIEESGQSTLAELLARQPGVQLSANGGPGAAAAVYLRGAEAAHTLVLVDGMRIRSATTGQAAIENIPLAEIDHIEILRGPASALYGSEAIGGVVQVFTRRDEDALRPSAYLGYGSFNTREADAGFGGAQGALSFGLRAGSYDTDGFNATNSRAPAYVFNKDKDPFHQKHVAGSLGYRLGGDDEIGASFLDSLGTIHYDDGAGPIDSRADTTLSSYQVHWLNHIRPDWTSQLRIGGSTDDSHNIDNYGDARFRTEQRQYQWQNDVRLPLGRALLALERSEDRVSGNTVYAVDRRTVDSALAGWSARLGSHDVQANVRHDDNSQFGGKSTWQAAYGYRLNDVWRAHVGAGTAFNAPTFNQLYYPDTGYGGGNPNLKPEVAHNVEAGIAYAQGDHSVSLTLFRNRIQDMIVWVFAGPVNGHMNVNRARIDGATLAYAGTWAGWCVTASIDTLDARDEATGNRLPRRADHQLQAAAVREFGAWNLGAEITDTGQRYDDPGNTPSMRMAGYALLNLFARYRLAPAWSVEARANNVTDVKYETAYGYSTARANLFLGVRYAPR
jgi:vitamin B12 transporter